MKIRDGIIAILALIFSAAFIVGCAGPHNTIDEPEITAEYLSGEYAAQLVRDGASVIFGNIDISEDEEGTIFVQITEKEFVEDSNQPNGFYIADRNQDITYQLASEARATFLYGGASVPEVMNVSGFLDAVMQDYLEYGEGYPDYSEFKLYDIYVMGEQIELLLARYIP